MRTHLIHPEKPDKTTCGYAHETLGLQVTEKPDEVDCHRCQDLHYRQKKKVDNG